jgi:hypothetical protein
MLTMMKASTASLPRHDLTPGETAIFEEASI